MSSNEDTHQPATAKPPVVRVEGTGRFIPPPKKEKSDGDQNT